MYIYSVYGSIYFSFSIEISACKLILIKPGHVKERFYKIYDRLLRRKFDSLKFVYIIYCVCLRQY